MIEKILEVLNEYSNNIGHGEEVITESQFDFIAEQIAEALGQIEPQVMPKIADLEEKYNELIMAVAKKFTNETRHQTALRYIQEAEKLEDNTPCKNDSNFSA